MVLKGDVARECGERQHEEQCSGKTKPVKSQGGVEPLPNKMSGAYTSVGRAELTKMRFHKDGILYGRIAW
jgi:hypothetical protein